MVEESASSCPGPDADAALARAFDLLGKRWNAVILGTLRNGPIGFRDISRSIGRISDSMLSGRLTELAQAGLVTRTVDEGPPVSVTYSLSECAELLIPALTQIAVWAQANLAD